MKSDVHKNEFILQVRVYYEDTDVTVIISTLWNVLVPNGYVISVSNNIH